MKLGFVSAILDGWTFEEMMDTAAGLGYECVEAACWPQGKAERRYAGVSHIDVDNDSREYVNHIQELRSAPWHIIPIPWTVIFRNGRLPYGTLKR